jgi:hypothetical protein
MPEHEGTVPKPFSGIIRRDERGYRNVTDAEKGTGR